MMPSGAGASLPVPGGGAQHKPPRRRPGRAGLPSVVVLARGAGGCPCDAAARAERPRPCWAQAAGFVLWPFTSTRIRLGGGEGIPPFSTEPCGPPGHPPSPCSLLGKQGHGEGLGARQDRARLKGLCWVKGLRGQGCARAPPGHGTTAGARRSPGLLRGQILPVPGPGVKQQREGQQGWGLRSLVGPCAGVGPGCRDWQGGEEGQEISQWLYGQHRVSCSSPGAGAAAGPDCAGPSPGRTPAPAPRRGPCGTHRLEGLCPSGALAGTGDPFVALGGGLSPGPPQTSCPAQRRAPAPSCSCRTLAAGQDTLGPQLGPARLPTPVLESWVLGRIQVWHVPPGLGTLSPS